MFRALSGYTATYGGLTLVVVSEMDEWKVLVHGPHVAIQGNRQFGADAAREHAVGLATSYLRDQKHASLPDGPPPEWHPTGEDDWLIWRK